MWKEMAEITWFIMIVCAAILVAYYVYSWNVIAAVFTFFIVFFLGAVGGYWIFEKEKSPIVLERKE